MNLFMVIDAETHDNLTLEKSLDDCERYISELLGVQAQARKDAVHFDYSVYDIETNELLPEMFIEEWFV